MKKQKLNLIMLAGGVFLTLLAATASAEERPTAVNGCNPRSAASGSRQGGYAGRTFLAAASVSSRKSGGSQSGFATGANKKADDPAAGAEAAKSVDIGLVGWITISTGAAGLLAAIAVLLLVLMIRKEQEAMYSELETVSNAVGKNASQIDKFGDLFQSKLRSALNDAVREKNPILREYDNLRTRIAEQDRSLQTRDAELKASREECAQAEQNIAQLNNDLGDTRNRLAETQQQLAACSDELSGERATSESLRTEIAGYRKFIGENILAMAPDQNLQEVAAADRSVLLALAKMSAMREAEMDIRSILREFQSFDNQLNVIIRDQNELQCTREAVKSFVEPLLDNKYRISWPRIGSSISEYNQNAELDLDESESGTTIKIVKCATIRFADAEGLAFQKAKVICD